MARWRQAVELAMTDEDIEKLTAIARSRSEAARRVERAQILLAYGEKSSFFAVGQRLGLHHQTVQRCVERALAYGPLTALDDRPRPGKEPTSGSRDSFETVFCTIIRLPIHSRVVQIVGHDRPTRGNSQPIIL
jgi:hypothetical protein